MFPLMQYDSFNGLITEFSVNLSIRSIQHSYSGYSGQDSAVSTCVHVSNNNFNFTIMTNQLTWIKYEMMMMTHSPKYGHQLNIQIGNISCYGDGYGIGKTPWPQSARELYRQSGRRRSTKLVPTFADRGVSRGQRNGSPHPLISVF